MAEQKVSTGCQGFDEMLKGGFLPGSANLVEGGAGTGKTTLGIQFLIEGLNRNENGLLVSFEEFPQQYLECAQALGWDLKSWQKKGMLEIIFSTPEEFSKMVDEESDSLNRIMDEKKIKRVLVDSVTHLEKLAQDVGELRAIETDIVNFFKREESTAILLKENQNILGGWKISKNKIPFIVDSYTLMRYIELNSEIQRGIMVLKMRGSDHDKSIRVYEIEEKGLVVGPPFKGVTGIFLGSGTPVRT